MAKDLAGALRGNSKQNALRNRMKRTGSGGRVRYNSNSTGQYGAVPSPPETAPGDINSYLGGNSDYQNQLRQLAKALTDFQADAGRRKGTLESEYGVSKKALADQKVQDLEGLEEDYASRGLLRSGVYAGAVGDYEKEYGERVSDLDRRQQQAMQMLMQEMSQYEQQNMLEQQAARELAIRNRAAQYGM